MSASGIEARVHVYINLFTNNLQISTTHYNLLTRFPDTEYEIILRPASYVY